MSGTICEYRAAKALAATLVVLAGLVPSARVAEAGEHTIVPVAGTGATAAATGTLAVNDTLRALNKLHAMGYRWTTATGADKAIRSWQTVNGLEPDGRVGPITLASLGLTVTASMPAVRQTQPAPSAPPPASAPAQPVGDVEQIIRDVWPPDLADHAVAIAMRESNLQSGAHNACCYGLMQIHKLHLAWLCPELGICSTASLLDARTNAEAAFALYQRNGWAPWSLG